MASFTQVQAIARAVHHGAIALVVAAITLALVVLLSGAMLLGVFALLPVPDPFLTLVVAAVAIVDVAMAGWAGVLTYRFMQRPPDAVPLDA